MGRRGPPKTPTKILKMRGSWRAKTRDGEPVPEQTRPRCPVWMRLRAKRMWRRLIPQLEQMGVLGRCDRNALARYCQSWARWREAEEFLMENGTTYPVYSEGGDVLETKQYPQVRQANILAGILLRIEKEFGLTPAARADLSVQRGDPQENRGKGGKWWRSA